MSYLDSEQFNNYFEKNINSISSISFSMSGGVNYLSVPSTLYTKNNDIMDSLIYVSIDQIRLIDLERDLYKYEKKYGISSVEFYKKWKGGYFADNLEFNKWAKLFKFFNYAS